MQLPEMRKYTSISVEPDDFDQFWADTLSEARNSAFSPVFRRVVSPLRELEVFDVAFSGFGGHTINGWLMTPKNLREAVPAVVSYRAYGGGRGLPYEKMGWAVAGYACLIVDTRGQGSAWGTGGITPDPVGSDPSFPGFMTRGIQDRFNYYYRRVYTDAVLAVDAIRQAPMVSGSKITVTGSSQGGGIALAVGGLVPDVAAVMPDVPFLCDFPRAVGLTGEDPYQEIAAYLAVHRSSEQEVFNTLAYFDGVHFAKRATAPALFSTGVMDQVCPPSTVFAAFNAYSGPADIEAYRFNGHEGGEGHHWVRQADWLSSIAPTGPQ